MAVRHRVATAAVTVLLVAVVAFQWLRPLPAPELVFSAARTFTVPGTPPTLPFPAAGQAAIYLDGTGWLGQTPGQSAVAIASVTKLMTALLVVRAHPLQPGQSGPAVVITAANRSLYQQEVSAGDSVVPVKVGESLTELQLLEGLLLPSGDNLATLLAQWTAGSEAAFVSQMNLEAKRLGMDQTVYADASGLNPGSISTASDLTRLARVVMANPVLASVVAMPEAVLPVAGTVRNYDFVLGAQGVVGLKTGWTRAAGGCFVFAARKIVDGSTAELVGAVLAQPGNAYTGIEAAENESVALLAAAWTQVEVVSVIPGGELVGTIKVPWSARVEVQAAAPVSILGWPGLSLRVSDRSLTVAPSLPEGSIVGTMTVVASGGPGHSTEVVNLGPITPPGPGWRLTRI